MSEKKIEKNNKKETKMQREDKEKRKIRIEERRRGTEQESGRKRK